MTTDAGTTDPEEELPEDHHYIDPKTMEVCEKGTRGAILMVFRLPKPPAGEEDEDAWLGDWLSRQLVEIKAAQEAHKAQAAAVANQLKAEEKALGYWLKRMEPVLASALVGSKKKSVRYGFGTFKFTKSSKIVVDDEFEAMLWAEDNCPGAIKTVKSLLTSKLPKGVDVPGVRIAESEKFGFTAGKKK